MNGGKEERKGIYFKREKRNRETDKAKKKRNWNVFHQVEF